MIGSEAAFLLLSVPLALVDGMLGLAALGAIIGGIAGLISGAGQQFVLWNKLTSKKGWLWATVLGWALRGAIMFPLIEVSYSIRDSIFGSRSAFSEGHLDDVIILALVGLVVGLEIGLAQWFVLRTVTKKAWLWPGVSTIAYLLGFGLQSVVATFTAQQFGVGAYIFGVLLVGSIAGVVTYTSLDRVLNLGRSTSPTFSDYAPPPLSML